MFEVLVESGARTRPPLGPRLASLSVHGSLLVVAALGVEQSVRAPSFGPVAVPIEIFSAPTRGGSPGPQTGTELSTVVPEAPQDVPTVIPTDLPLPEIPGRSTWTTPTAREMAGGGATESIGREGPAAGDIAVRLAGEVDEPVEVLVPARPVYPPRLVSAGIEGEVRVEFVVDTAGRCEPSSVRIVSSTNPAFEASAQAAVCEAKYRAGRVRGQPVRQLVQQKVAFRQIVR